MVMMMDLSGKIALVTGASSGIGEATAQRLGEAGATIVCADIQDELGKQVIQDLLEAGAQASYVHCDVSQAQDLQAAVDHAVDTYGALHIAVNNAGVEGGQGPTAEQTRGDWDRVIGINLTGVFEGMRAEIPALLEAGGGAIVNVSSIAGLRGFEGLGPYVASKHGVNGLTKAAALEYAKQGIRINAVCPGVIDTPMVARATGGDPDAEAGYAQAEPVGRLGTPQEVAEAIVWLCSDAAAFVTGTTFPVDGGWTAR